jgi:hypothetical protein
LRCRVEMEECLRKMQAAASTTSEYQHEKPSDKGVSGWLSFMTGISPAKSPKKSPRKAKAALSPKSADEMQEKRVATLRTALQITLAHGNVDKDKSTLVKAVNRLCKDASATRRTCRLLRKWKQKAEVADMRNIILKERMTNELQAVTTQLRDERARIRRITKAREIEWQMASRAVQAKNEMNATLWQLERNLTAQICYAREQLLVMVAQADSNRYASRHAEYQARNASIQLSC